MIEVTIGTNTNREKTVVDPNRTLRSVLEEHEVNYAVSSVCLDGATLKPGDMDKTFTEMGVKDRCFLIAVIKADNSVVFSTVA